MKKNNSIILILIMLLSLLTSVSCDKLGNNETDSKGVKSTNDTIQLWCNFSWNITINELKYNIIRKAKNYCEKNNIPLEVVEFDPKVLSYEDYVFKRNLAANNGNTIIVDDISTLSDLAKHHADYTKLKVYNNILEPYRDRFCIPVGIVLKPVFIDNVIFKYYNIDTSQSQVITYTDYFEIKQEMKKRGAKFEHKNESFYETVKYYLYKNNLLYINKRDNFLKDNDKLKESLKRTIFDVCEDIILYDDATIDESIKIIIPEFTGLEIYDSNSELYLRESNFLDNYVFASINYNWFKHEYVHDPSNKTFIVDYYTINCEYYSSIKSPGFFMHEKITNEKIYDLADYILEQSSYTLHENTRQYRYVPILYTEKVLNDLELNSNLEYKGRGNENQRKIINETFNIFAKDEEKSLELADAYFTDVEIVWSMESLVYDAVHAIAEMLSDGNLRDGLSLKRFDRNNDEINRLVNKKIDEFIQELSIKLLE